MTTHSSTLAWKIPWMEEPGRLQSMGSRRVGHNWATELNWTERHISDKAMVPHSSTPAWKIPWMEVSGRLRSMASLRVGQNWATSLSLSCIGEGNGNPLQCSCLENLRDGGALWASIYGVTQSWTQLKRQQQQQQLLGNQKILYKLKDRYIIAHCPSHLKRNGAFDRPVWILHTVYIALIFTRWFKKWSVLSKVWLRKDSLVSGLITLASWSCTSYADSNNDDR